jgi:hypothetical protein
MQYIIMLSANFRAFYVFSFQKRVLKYCAVLTKNSAWNKPACSDDVRFHYVYRQSENASTKAVGKQNIPCSLPASARGLY